jgi:hypothetical protein
MMMMKSNFLIAATSVLLLAFVLLSPTIVMAQVSPWSLFQQLCSIGRLATGPQCTGLFQGQNQQSQIPTGQNPLTQQQLQQLQQQPFSSTTIPTIGPVQTVPTILSPVIANAGPNQVVSRGAIVTLDGTGSTGSVSTLNGVQSTATITQYLWQQTSGPTLTLGLTGANTARPTFTAPTNATSLVFSLSVQDSTGLIGNPATVSISVQ